MYCSLLFLLVLTLCGLTQIISVEILQNQSRYGVWGPGSIAQNLTVFQTCFYHPSFVGFSQAALLHLLAHAMIV